MTLSTITLRAFKPLVISWFLCGIAITHVHAEVGQGNLRGEADRAQVEALEIHRLKEIHLPLPQRLKEAIRLQEANRGAQQGGEPGKGLQEQSLRQQEKASRQAQKASQIQQKQEIDWQAFFKEMHQAKLKSESNLLQPNLRHSEAALTALKAALALLSPEQQQSKEQENKEGEQNQDQPQSQSEAEEESKPQEAERENQPQEAQAPKEEKPAEQAELERILQQQEFEKKERRKQLGLPRQRPKIQVERDW